MLNENKNNIIYQEKIVGTYLMNTNIDKGTYLNM